MTNTPAVCFLCRLTQVSWPGTGLCEPCFQETADLAHHAWTESYNRMSPAERGPSRELTVIREHGTIPQSQLVSAIYDELSNLAMGRGLHLGGSATCPDDGRHVIAVASPAGTGGL